MFRTLLTLVLALGIGCVAYAQDPSAKKKWTPPTPEELFKSLDKDKNGFVSLDELTASLRTDDGKKAATELYNANKPKDDKGLTLDEFKSIGDKYREIRMKARGQGGKGKGHGKKGGDKAPVEKTT